VFWLLQLNSEFSGVSEDSQVPISGVWVSSSHSFKVGLWHYVWDEREGDGSKSSNVAMKRRRRQCTVIFLCEGGVVEKKNVMAILVAFFFYGRSWREEEGDDISNFYRCWVLMPGVWEACLKMQHHGWKRMKIYNRWFDPLVLYMHNNWRWHGMSN